MGLRRDVERQILSCKACEWLVKGQEAFDEPSVEVGKSNKGLYVAEGPWRFSLLDSCNLLEVHFQALG